MHFQYINLLAMAHKARNPGVFKRGLLPVTRALLVGADSASAMKASSLEPSSPFQVEELPSQVAGPLRFDASQEGTQDATIHLFVHS